MATRTSRRRRLRTKRAWFILVPTFIVAAVALSGIGAHAQSGAATAAKSATLEKARYFGQCEIFLLKGKPGNYEALVYNTTPLNDCPPARFDPIDPAALAKTQGRTWSGRILDASGRWIG